MASENLNECVDALLEKKSKAAFQQHAAALENAKRIKDGQITSEDLLNLSVPDKDAWLETLGGSMNNAIQSTSENSADNETTGMQDRSIPRVVIRHRIKGAKKAQKRLRKNSEQNKILMVEFEKNPNWQKPKIVELQKRLGLKASQIYKWNWDMQRKTTDKKGPLSHNLSA